MDYRRFFRQITMLSIATGLLASCSKDNAEEPEPGFISEAVEIAPILSLESESNNSIIYYPGPQDGLDEDLTLFFARADEISAGTYGAYTHMDGTSEITGVRSKGPDKQALTFTPTQYYQVNGLKTKMVGWYPQATTQSVFGQTALIWNTDGSQDIMIATKVEGNNKTETINFDFKHALAQIQFKAYAESAVAQSQWGEITSIKILNQYNSYMSQLLVENQDNNIALMPNTMFGGTTTAFDLKNINQQGFLPTEKTNAIRIGDPMMILTTNIQLQLEITTNRYPDPVSVTVPVPDKPYTAGEATTIYLLFKQGKITVTLEPTDWRVLEDDTQDDVEVGENRSYVVKEMNYIINRNMFGDAEFDNEEWTVRPNDLESTWTAWDDSQRDPKKVSVPAILEIQESDASDATYENAITACNALGNGWRLPTSTELELIYLYNNQLATPLQGIYWSATATSAGGSKISKAYTINMENGEIDEAADATQPHHVRCVRDIEM